MANYGGKSPLRMRCPHCGQSNEHFVLQTDPAIYHWSEAEVPFFERIAGRDLSYRKRTKRCRSCETEFATVEMAELYLDAFMKEVKRLQLALAASQAEHLAQGEQIARLEAVISEVKSAVSEPPKR